MFILNRKDSPSFTKKFNSREEVQVYLADTLGKNLTDVKKSSHKMFSSPTHSYFGYLIQLDSESLTDEDSIEAALDQVEKPKEESPITFQKQQIDHLRSKIKQLEKHTSMEDHIIEMFSERLTKFTPSNLLKDNFSTRPGATEEELVLVLTDWHAGETVYGDQVLGLNEYNREIFIQRVDNVYNSFISICNKLTGYSFKKLHVFLLGDMLGGNIHQELLENSEPIVDQVILGGEVMAETIQKLSKRFKSIEVTCVVGNHGRTSKQPYFKNKYNNFDYLAYKYAEAKCAANPNIKFDIPKAAMAIKQILGYNFLLRHGDMKVASFAGIPFYGISRAENSLYQNLNSGLGIIPHYTVMGHFHQSADIGKAGGRLLMCGSIKGVDEYSLNSGFGLSGPSQLMFSVHKKRGITLKLDIDAV